MYEFIAKLEKTGVWLGDIYRKYYSLWICFKIQEFTVFVKSISSRIITKPKIILSMWMLKLSADFAAKLFITKIEGDTYIIGQPFIK